MTSVSPVISTEEAAKVLADLSHAHTLPGKSYTSEAFLQAEYDHVFRTQWYPVANIQQLPNAGDFQTLDLCGEKLVVVRGHDDEIRVLSRTCLQSGKDLYSGGFARGNHAENTLGTLLRHQCWMYDLSGQLQSAPDQQTNADFDVTQHQLQSYRTESWQGFVLVNLDGQAAPFADNITSLAKDLDAYQLGNLEMLSPEPVTFEMDTNWKVVIENYLESYHHLAIHRNTFETVSPARTTYVDDQVDNVVTLRNPIAKTFEDAFEWTLPPIDGLEEHHLTQFPVFLMLPCFLITPTHNQVVWYQLIPDGPERTYLNAFFFIPAAYRKQPDALRAMLDQAVAIHNEDMDACLGTQIGMRSEFFEQGRLHPLEKGVWLFDKHILEKIREGDARLMGQ